ncbi:polysaccharide deacetylase family protein [Krasilnikovia sp. MM14-A1259]|uniref:polysaccharide deacetylase family protein n=1 Tax=Krasilnikovia sp. MM14-A1259 TaxID=3373539 RepID=UPI0037F25036
MSRLRRAATAAGIAASALLAAQAAPAISAVGPVRRTLWPGLSGRGRLGHVALTFDDGPHPEATPQVLRILDNAGVQATFFLLARMVSDHPRVAQAIAAAGHEIAVHGHDHRLLLRRGPAATRTDLTMAVQVIAEFTGTVPRWWRPPYGVATTAALYEARRLGLTPVLWTHWGRDWTRRATPGSVARSVLWRPVSGGTILLHDSDHAAVPRCWEATVGALPGILAACRARGLDVGPLRDHGIASTAAAKIGHARAH